MGSGDWLKTIISLKKAKKNSSKQVKEPSALAKSNSSGLKSEPGKVTSGLANGDHLGMSAEDRAALKIQTAFRAYKARKSLRCLKGIARLQTTMQNMSIKKQATTTLDYLHSWSRIQSNVRARRLCMVTEGRLKQKKLENQLKLEAKLHDLEVEWCGGSETMEEVLAKIHQREEAAVKRERAMAYAFNHQWRANSNPIYGSNAYEVGKANWGWSWKERWIAARPWESRVPVKSISPKKSISRQGSKGNKITPQPTPKQAASSPKPPPSNGKTAPKPRRLSYPPAEKPNNKRFHSEGKEANNKKDQGSSPTQVQ
ncbi:hypothetical protein SAY86_011945 [Trapa natans]|uniref:Protein IQ-DOMAIN 1 n=1 Tax=Trapa natans TaxID=22666 RepID=A0AAN7RB51_TRANT|nr:hypothetical protein SAY86_011945 [Trapa natans]